MPNHNKQIVSKEDKEEYNSKAIAQLFRARVDNYSQDNSLPWEEGKKTTTPRILSGSYISQKKRAISNKGRNRN